MATLVEDHAAMRLEQDVSLADMQTSLPFNISLNLQLYYGSASISYLQSTLP